MAYSLLAKRPLFELEVHEKLLSVGFSYENVVAAIERLRQQGVLNDQKLMEVLLSKNIGKKSISNHLLLERLRARGAPDIQPGQSDTDAIRELLKLRFTKQNVKKEKSKAARFLSSRGFEPDQIEAAVESYFLEEEL